MRISESINIRDNVCVFAGLYLCYTMIYGYLCVCNTCYIVKDGSGYYGNKQRNQIFYSNNTNDLYFYKSVKIKKPKLQLNIFR